MEWHFGFWTLPIWLILCLLVILGVIELVSYHKKSGQVSIWLSLVPSHLIGINGCTTPEYMAIKLLVLKRVILYKLYWIPDTCHNPLLKSDNSFWLLRTIWYNWDPGLYELTSTMERIIGVKAVSNWWGKKRISPCLMEWTTFSKPETNDSEGFGTSFISGFSRMFDGFSMDFQWFSMDFHGFSAAGRIRHPAGPAFGASPPTSAFPASGPAPRVI